MSKPAKKAKTEKDFESMYYDLLLEVKVLVRWSLDLKGLPGAGVDVGAMDNKEYAHTPYVVLLSKLLGRW